MTTYRTDFRPESLAADVVEAREAEHDARAECVRLSRQDCDCPCLSCAIGVHGYCGVCEDDYLWITPERP